MATAPRRPDRPGAPGYLPGMRAASLWLALVLLGCGSPTEPSTPVLEFQEGIVFGIPTLPTTVMPEPGGLLVTGVVQTATTGFTLFAALSVESPAVLRIDINAFETGPGFFFPTQNYFRARVKNLAPGDYALTVYHTNHALPEAEPVLMLEQTVRVP